MRKSYGLVPLLQIYRIMFDCAYGGQHHLVTLITLVPGLGRCAHLANHQVMLYALSSAQAVVETRMDLKL